MTEEGRAEIDGCRVLGNRWPVIVGGAHASLVVRDSEVVDNLDHGIVSADGATITVERCSISRNALSGVLLLGAAPSSRVESNEIVENGVIGVFVEAGRGRVAGNRIHGNHMGIGIAAGAAPTIEGNEITENQFGLGLRGAGADPRVSGNTIAGSRAEGVMVDDAAAGRFESNTVSGSGGPGIWLNGDGTAARLHGNHVNSSAVGILVTAGAGGASVRTTARQRAWLVAPGQARAGRPRPTTSRMPDGPGRTCRVRPPHHQTRRPRRPG